jgi:carbonic anhydrase/acetyltransferase-like protein (isoleucine patch superfamily)
VIRAVPGRTPRVHPDTWIDPFAQVIGDVIIAAGASIWPGTIVRGDQDNYIKVERNT